MRAGLARRFAFASIGILALSLASALLAQPAPPEIVPRTAWRAKAANAALMKRQAPREIVIHHTSVRQQPKRSLEQKLQALQSFSQSPGTVGTRAKPAWGDVPYHYYIDVAGRIGEGRDIDFAGDTNTRYSTADRIQIVLEGDFDKEQPSPPQLLALERLVAWLAGKYKVPASKISGHNDHVPTSCPGGNLKGHLPSLRDVVAKGSSPR